MALGDSMSDLYGPEHRALQAEFDTVRLADRISDLKVVTQITDEYRGFIETRDAFFLTTVDHRGYPTCSHKGGERGFVRVLDAGTLAFPLYDGNGMFLSQGNIVGRAKVGMLFIDFETPHRVRLHGDASIDRADPLVRSYAGAQAVVRVAVREVFVNCPRYVHRYRRVADSPYVPTAACPVVPPQWKRIDALQDALPARDRGIAASLGGVITPDEYGAQVMKGEG
jgi:uncharacterized protein